MGYSEERKYLCIYLEEKNEGIGKIRFIKDVTNPILTFEFIIRPKKKFKDTVA